MSPLPMVKAPMRLVANLSWMIGAPGRNANSGSTTAGRGIEIEGDQLSCVFGGVAALRHDHRNGLADMPDFVVSQQGLLGIDELVLDERGPFSGERELRV